MARTDKLAVLHSSKTHDWETPQSFFRELNWQFNFNVDMAASKGNALRKRYWDEKKDAFAQDWSRVRGFCNPPYGRGIGEWTNRAAATVYADCCVVMLLPARTDVRWWWDVKDFCNTVFLKGRLKFANTGSARLAEREGLVAAPFPSCLLVFGFTNICGEAPRILTWDPKNDLWPL